MGGINAPPKIAIIKRDEPWLVYFPNPAIANANMAGHMIELYNPRLINDQSENSPVVTMDKINKTIQITENKSKVREGFSFPIKNAMILTPINGK